MMNLPLGENQNIEFKESWNDKYLQWICGFANAQGGTLYVGIADDGKVLGLHDAKKLMEDIPNKVLMSMGILVDVNLCDENNKEFITIDVKPSATPISCKGKFYYRSGSTNQELNGIALQNFLLNKNNITWDSLPFDGASLKDIDPDSVEYFLRRGVRFGRLPASTLGFSAERILKNLNLMTDDGSITNAAILLFGYKPQSFFIGATFRIGRFRDDEANILYQDEVTGNLIHMPDAVLDLLKGKYLISNINFNGLQRIEELEIPEEAMREILCNSIVHRDYRGSHTQMKIYDDHIRLWNDGGLINGMTIESLRQEHNSCPRNKLIAQIFYLAGYIETWGRGIQKIDDAFTTAKLSVPLYEETGEGIVINIPRAVSDTNVHKDVHKNVHKELSDRQIVILIMIRENANVGRLEMSTKIGVNEKTIRRDLEDLQNRKIIVRVGGRKDGHWEIL